MKKIILIIFCLISFYGLGQNKATLMFSQDLRLATIGDNKGNEAFTTNIRIASEWQGNQLKHGFFFGRPEIEYADFDIPYLRTSLNIGYRHNKFSRHFDVSYSLGYGMIKRRYENNNWYATQQFSGDIYLYLKLNNKISIFSNAQIVDRTVLNKIIVSHFIGLEVNF